MKKGITVKPVFIQTRNVRNFQVMMDGLGLGEGEGRLGIVYGRAGRGKTRTSQWYQAHNGCIYLRVATVWRTSELEFLKALCVELGLTSPPSRKGACFTEIVDILLAEPRPVFIDELEKLPRVFLDLVRDISDISTAPFILIGEEEILPYVRRNRRVWSRTFQQLEFMPISESDIVYYTSESTGLEITAGAASIIHRASDGDFRLVRRNLLSLVQIANSKGAEELTEDMAKIAVKTGLTGR